MTTCAIYSRVSTEDQEREGTSLQTQLEACLKYCQDKGYNVAYQFTEAYSGLTLERPKLNELRELVRVGNIDVIVVYCLDRLSRDPTHGVILTQELEKHHVILEAVTETVESTELGKLINYIRGFASKLEAEKIRERTMRGKRARVKEGKLPQGTGVGIYGYDWNKGTKRREVNLYEAEIIREIFSRVAAGEKLLPIARDLNQRGIPTKATIISKDPDDRKWWHSLTLRRIIRNTAYVGKTYFSGTLLPDVSPAIVTEELFAQANDELNKPKARTGRPKNEYLLKHHVFCQICGRPLVGHCLNRKYRYYQCSAARPFENAKTSCAAKYVRAGDLEEIVWGQIKDIISNPQIVIAEIKKQLLEADKGSGGRKLENDIATLGKRLRAYARRRSNLLEAMEIGDFDKDEILDRLNNVKQAQAEDEAKLKQLLNIKDNISRLEKAQLGIAELQGLAVQRLESCSSELKILALKALDVKVYASTEHIEITGVIPLDLPTTARTSA
jgi:site-specific DNA recombinase